MTELRGANEGDAPSITRIDAEGLATGHATFREKPHDWSSFEKAYETGRGISLLAMDGGHVAGWAGVSPTSARDVYKGVGEVSIYVSREKQGKGLGRELLLALVSRAEEQGYWTLVAQIFPENKASLSLHEACGFKRLGVRSRLGRMTYGPHAGRWRDVVMMERRSVLIGK
ncbi:L-methionine sulfoximine/L-methionine sulfone acetyltransferase (plasmid) [Roseobacter fucihabitans]|uniref:L-methionine sulfoximine/L-methionine sulfone acetyltransferase n=1 Tax=Roseobacter fucihabitans TaxID=1537242 RepID=A0ABZ2BZM1_9RHOB|nr:GNAT family N-acetyltransferase [Roseobacter litoralis]MBC6965970.1 Phosphinothricin N-acetyltransferase [Roseobacter litoralis]